jgi:general secretion pathway protein L
MERRTIGIHIDGDILRVAILAQDGQRLISLGRRTFGSPEEMIAAVQEIVGSVSIPGDRLATALPALGTFFRRLKFPFADPRKIESTLPFELSSQLPVSIDEYTIDFQAPVPSGENLHQVNAAAVRTDTLEKTVDLFDGADIPVHIVDLAPFAYVRGLREHIPDGILACMDTLETTISLVAEGRVSAYRVIPVSPESTVRETARMLLRESAALQREAHRGGPALTLIGSGVMAELVDILRPGSRAAGIPRFTLEGREVEPEYLPALALALRAAMPARQREFNFRRGRYALRNEWSTLKKEMIAAASVLLLTLLIVAGSAYQNYAHKAQRAEQLQQRMTAAFRETFPGSAPMVDIPLQMRSKIAELRQQARQLGSGPQGSALRVLQEISSSIPAEVTLDVRDLNFTAESVRLEGVSTSFEAINQIARSLEQSPLFAQAQIADAKMSLDGSRVDFRLHLSFAKPG